VVAQGNSQAVEKDGHVGVPRDDMNCAGRMFVFEDSAGVFVGNSVVDSAKEIGDGREGVSRGVAVDGDSVHLKEVVRGFVYLGRGGDCAQAA